MHGVQPSSIQPAPDPCARRLTRAAPIRPHRRYRGALSMLLATVLIVGCAQQYHWYDCGCSCVDYRYCPPGPLPYAPYCSCPTPIAESYNFQLAHPSSADTSQAWSEPESMVDPPQPESRN